MAHVNRSFRRFAWDEGCGDADWEEQLARLSVGGATALAQPRSALAAAAADSDAAWRLDAARVLNAPDGFAAAASALLGRAVPPGLPLRAPKPSAPLLASGLAPNFSAPLALDGVAGLRSLLLRAQTESAAAADASVLRIRGVDAPPPQVAAASQDAARYDAVEAAVEREAAAIRSRVGAGSRGGGGASKAYLVSPPPVPTIPAVVPRQSERISSPASLLSSVQPPIGFPLPAPPSAYQRSGKTSLLQRRGDALHKSKRAASVASGDSCGSEEAFQARLGADLTLSLRGLLLGEAPAVTDASFAPSCNGSKRKMSASAVAAEAASGGEPSNPLPIPSAVRELVRSVLTPRDLALQAELLARYGDDIGGGTHQLAGSCGNKARSTDSDCVQGRMALVCSAAAANSIAGVRDVSASSRAVLPHHILRPLKLHVNGATESQPTAFDSSGRESCAFGGPGSLRLSGSSIRPAVGP